VTFSSFHSPLPALAHWAPLATLKVSKVRLMAWVTLCALGPLLMSCSSTTKPQAKEVVLSQVAQVIESAQSFTIAPFNAFMVPYVKGSQMTFASENGTITQIDLKEGKVLWTLDLKTPLSSGVGSDGVRYTVTTKSNQVLTFDQKGPLWKSAMTALSITPPLVAGERVFVLLADRSVLALDGQSGRILWTQQRSGDPLTLNQMGVLMAVKDTLVVGFSGRLLGLNPLTGQSKFETPIAVPRGVNDLERLVDLVSPAYRFGDMVCVRAFQAQVGCVNTQRGTLLWSRVSNGDQGLSGNEDLVVSTESNGVVLAWSRTSGEKMFETDVLKYRKLSAPLVLSQGIVVSDNQGVVYLLSLKDGRLLNKLDTQTQATLGLSQPLDTGFLYASRAGKIRVFNLPLTNVKLTPQ